MKKIYTILPSAFIAAIIAAIPATIIATAGQSHSEPLIAGPTAQSNDVTIDAQIANGSFTSKNGSSFAWKWTSTATDPQFTITSGGQANNMKASNGHIATYAGTANSCVYTIEAGSSHFVSHVKLVVKDLDSNGTIDVTMGSKTITPSATEQTIEADFAEGTPATFTVAKANKGAELIKCEITASPISGDAPVAPVEPSVPEKPTVGGSPEQWAVSTLSGGQFAPDTKWYLLTLGNAGLSIPYAAGSDRITLGGETLGWTDSQLWCITGSASTGYTIYNKAAGPGMVLASPVQMTGNGKDSYAILKAPGDAAYSYTWDITPSDKISGKTGFFISQHGNASNTINNNANQNILSFWTGGKDQGSTFLFYSRENAPLKPEFLKAPVIFPQTGDAPYNVVYRIPAIAVVGKGAHEGRIISFIDYRKNNSDISASSDTDLHFTYSDDGGETWTHPAYMCDASGTPVSWAKHGERLQDPTSIRDNSFSDPCAVADRESQEILVMSCAGRPESGWGFWGSRYPGKYRQEIARWYSADGGDTWTPADFDLTELVYGKLLAGAYNGEGIDGMFIGSGKIHQSRHVKVGKYWRLYAALSTQLNGNSGSTLNYVIYSDDFGRTWELLGHDPTSPAVNSNADEPKCEELPDGSVAIIARGHGGNRNYNIFTFTDVEKGYGTWDNYANRNILGQFINACNGEPLMVPAVEKATGNKCYVLLQSIPFSGSREKVSIAYKKIAGPETFNTPALLGENWEGRLQVSSIGSVYSTMAQMPDGNIAFLYEENTWGPLSGVFRKFNLAEITGGKYEYTPDPDGAISKSLVEGYDPIFNKRKVQFDEILAAGSKYVGQLAGTSLEQVKALINEYYQTRSHDLLRQIDLLLTGCRDIIGITEGPVYTILNSSRGDGKTYYMTLDAQNQLAGINKYSDACDWTFEAASASGRSAAELDEFFIKHVKTGRYVVATGANESRTATTETTAGAAVYRYTTDANGKTALICTTPGGPNNSLHLATDNNRVVPWTATADASLWLIAPDNVSGATVTGIDEIAPATGEAPQETFYDIYGRPASDLRPGNLYISNRGRKIIAR